MATMTALVSWLALTAAVATEPLALLDPVALAEAKAIALNSVAAEVVDLAGGKALQLAYDARTDWPNAKFDAPRAYQQIDWSEYGALAVTVTNPGPAQVTLAMRIDDDPAANGNVHCRQGSYDLAAGQTATISMPLATLPGMRGSPPMRDGGVVFRSNNAALNLTNMIAFQLFLPRPKADQGRTAAVRGSAGLCRPVRAVQRCGLARKTPIRSRVRRTSRGRAVRPHGASRPDRPRRLGRLDRRAATRGHRAVPDPQAERQMVVGQPRWPVVLVGRCHRPAALQ
jgi:hypothetical protein